MWYINMNDITHTSMIQGACKFAVRPLQPYTFKSEHPSNTIESNLSIGKAINFLRPIKIWEMFLWRRAKIPTMGISPPAQVISSSSFNPPVIHFSIQVQNTRINVFAKGDHAMSYQEDVVNFFQEALKWILVLFENSSPHLPDKTLCDPFLHKGICVYFELVCWSGSSAV